MQAEQTHTPRRPTPRVARPRAVRPYVPTRGAVWAHAVDWQGLPLRWATVVMSAPNAQQAACADLLMYTRSGRPKREGG
jgi:hypothetical protein